MVHNVNFNASSEKSNLLKKEHFWCCKFKNNIILLKNRITVMLLYLILVYFDVWWLKKTENPLFTCIYKSWRESVAHSEPWAKNYWHRKQSGSTRKLTFPFLGVKLCLFLGWMGAHNGTDGIRIVTTNGLGVLQGCLTEPIMSLVTSLHSLLAWVWMGVN